LQKFAARIPGRLGDKLSGGTRLDIGDLGNPTFTFWFEGPATIPGHSLGLVVDGKPWPGVFAGMVTKTLPSGRIGRGLAVGTWPRRERMVTVQLMRPMMPEASEVLAEFKVPNPSFKTYANWKADPMPASQRVGTTVFTLEGLELRQPGNPGFMANMYPHPISQTALLLLN